MSEDEIKGWKLEKLGLKRRDYNSLKGSHVEAVCDLLEMYSDKERLLKIRSMGVTSVIEITNKLKIYLGMAYE